MMPERTSCEALRNNLQHRQWLGFRLVLAQSPEHVLDIDDRIVDELADGDGEAAQGHGVDAQAEQMEHDHRDQDGDRNGGQRDGCRAPVEEEQEQDECHDDERFDQHAQHIVDRRR